ncbi:MAG: hypothetical protein ACLT4C_04625 [Butyricicoccus sp.]
MRRKAAFAGKNNFEEDKHEKKIVIGFSRCDGADYGAGGICYDGDASTAVSSASGSNDSAVAKIGDIQYATLADAVAAAQSGETVKLLTTAEDTIAQDKNITLDLNGKKRRMFRAIPLLLLRVQS